MKGKKKAVQRSKTPAKSKGTLPQRLTTKDARAVKGGEKFSITQDVTVNKAKTADKAFQAMNAYIRG